MKSHCMQQIQIRKGSELLFKHSRTALKIGPQPYQLSGTSATESYIKGNHHSKSGHIYVANHISYTSYTQMVFGPSSILTVKVRNRKGTERGQPSFFIVDRDHFDFVVFKKKIWHTTRKVAQLIQRHLIARPKVRTRAQHGFFPSATRHLKVVHAVYNRTVIYFSRITYINSLQVIKHSALFVLPAHRLV